MWRVTSSTWPEMTKRKCVGDSPAALSKVGSLKCSMRATRTKSSMASAPTAAKTVWANISRTFVPDIGFVIVTLFSICRLADIHLATNLSDSQEAMRTV